MIRRWSVNLFAFLHLVMQQQNRHVYRTSPPQAHKANKQIQTPIVMRACFYLRMTPRLDTLPFPHVWQRCHSRSFSSHVPSVNTSPLSLLLLASLSPRRQDAHAIVLSRPYWSSDVELIKDNLRGVSLPLSRTKSLWQSDGPLIVILLLVWIGQIIPLQAHLWYFLLFPFLQFPVFIYSNSTPSLPSSVFLPLQTLACSTTLVNSNLDPVHFLSFCSDTAPQFCSFCM